MVALAGDNGAGKSTVIKAISGVFRYDEGDIELDGRRIAFSSPQEARDNGIETIYQDLALADNLSIGANIFLGREPMTKRFGFLPVIDRKHDGRRGEGDHGEARLPRRAGSMRRSRPSRAASARRSPSAAPSTGTPRLVIMDEPTAALGVPEQRKVISLIKSLKAQGKGIIFISHNLRDIFEVADRIVVFRRGENAGERKPDETSQRRDRPADGGEVARL